MKRFSFALALVLAATGGAKASSTYNIVNDPLDQNGYTLSGTITTDGTLGVLTNANITAWSYTVSGGPGGFTVDNNSGPGAVATLRGVVTATSTEILVGDPQQQFFSSLGLGDNADTIGSIVWASTGGNLYQGFSDVSGILWNAQPPAGFPADAPWVVATTGASSVPEPVSLVLACMAGVGCTALGLARKRRTD